MINNSLNFPALCLFAKLDDKFLKNSPTENFLFAKTQVKKLMDLNFLSAFRISLVASTLYSLDAGSLHAKEIIDEFYVKASNKHLLSGYMDKSSTELTQQSINEIVALLIQSSQDVHDFPKSVSLLKDHSIAKELYRKELENLITKIYAQTNSIHQQTLDQVYRLLDPVINELPVGNETKKYLDHKIKSVFNDFLEKINPPKDIFEELLD